MNRLLVNLQMSLHKARNTKRRRLVTNKTLEVSNHLTGRVITSKTRRAMEETKGTSDTPHHGILPLSTRKATKPFRAGILRMSEEVMKIRDKLPLVDPTRINDSLNLLYTGVDSNRHMGVRKGTAPTDSKALIMSAVMSVMRGDMLTNPKDDSTTPIVTSMRRKVDKAMGLRFTLDPVTSIVTLGKVIHTAARGSPTRAAMTNTESVITTVNAKVVMGVVGMAPLVTGTSGLQLYIDMKVLRLRAMEKGRGSMGAMKTGTIPLVSNGSACKTVMKITQSDGDIMIICIGMTNRKLNTCDSVGTWKFRGM